MLVNINILFKILNYYIKRLVFFKIFILLIKYYFQIFYQYYHKNKFSKYLNII